MTARHIDRTETAKLIRKALKNTFPGVKFSVRSESYSGGGAINVHWVDGPTEKAVNQIIGAYEGRGFDGMVDQSYYFNAWLQSDGTVSIAKCAHLDIDNPAPSADAELVHFGSGYMSVGRYHSPELVNRVAAEVAEQIGWDAPEIIETTSYWNRTKQIPTAYFKDARGSDNYDENTYREFANALHNTDANEPAKSECLRAREEYEAWKTEQDAIETTEQENEQAKNEAIHTAEIAGIETNRETSDSADSKVDALKGQLMHELRILCTEIIAATDSIFVWRCASRKIAALNGASTLEDLIQVGDDLTLMAESFTA